MLLEGKAGHEEMKSEVENVIKRFFIRIKDTFRQYCTSASETVVNNTLHATRYTLHSTLYTLHSTLYTPHSTLYTLHSTLHTPHSTPYTLHSTSSLHSVPFALFTPHSPLLAPSLYSSSSVSLLPHASCPPPALSPHVATLVFTPSTLLNAFPHPRQGQGDASVVPAG